MPCDVSILGGGVIGSEEESDRVEGEEEEDVGKFNIHGFRPDEASWKGSIGVSCFLCEKHAHSRRPRWEFLGVPELQERGGQTGLNGTKA